MTRVFIDGSAGTTGLRIYERLENRKDTRLLKLSEEKRKDKNARKEGAEQCRHSVFVPARQRGKRVHIALRKRKHGYNRYLNRAQNG